LSVIAARLRFSDIADKADRFLKLARSHKEKSVALYQNGTTNEQSRERFDELNNKISDELGSAHQELGNMIPVTSYMRFFRNAGIFTFMIILISSSLFISGLLSFLFAILGLSTIIYFNRSKLSEIGILLKRNSRILFVRKGYYLLMMGLLSYFMGIFARVILKWEQSDGLVSIGLILIGLFFFSIIAVMPVMDRKFEEATSGKVFFTPKAWNVIRIVWGGVVFLFFVGFLLRFIEKPGAGLAIFISIPVLAILYLILGYQFSVKKWMGILLGFGISTQIVGIMFKILHFPGAAIMLSFGLAVFTILYLLLCFKLSERKWLGILGGVGFFILNAGLIFKILHYSGAPVLLILGISVLPLFAISIFLLRNYFSLYFHRILVINAIVITFMGYLFLWDNYNKFQLGYQYYTLDFHKIDEMIELKDDAVVLRDMVFSDINNLIESNNMVNEHINRFYSFRQEFDPVVNFSDIHRLVIRSYYWAACYLLENGKSPAQLEIGLKFTRAANDVGENIDFQPGGFYGSFCNHNISFLPLLETELLLKLDRKDEAENALVKLIDIAPSDIKAELQQRLTEISK